MLNLALVLLVAGMIRPAFALDQVTADELEELVARSHRKPDAGVAKQIAELRLKERLSQARLERLQAEMPGDESRQALIGVADAAEFLDLPASDIPVKAAPDPAAQNAMLARTRDFVQRVIPRLPNLFATQDTLEFSDSPRHPSQTADNLLVNRRLSLVGTARATVRYAAGNEEVEALRNRGNGPAPSRDQPVAEGVFALAYGVVLGDALAGTPSWSHWENGKSGPVAVFHYDVPMEKSHYSVAVPGDEGLILHHDPYDGEIAVDPASGAILRLTLVARRGATTPVAKANILIEYGPVDIGGTVYICPLKSVALSLSRNLDIQHDIYKFSQPVNAPFYLRLNDVRYSQFHLFHSETRILPATDQPPDKAAPVAPAPPATPPNR